MHNTCTCPCLICEACNSSTWIWILFQWIWDTLNTNNLHLDSCSLNPSVEIGLCFINLAFSPLLCTWLLPNSPCATLPLENLDEVQRCSELLHRDGLCHHIRWILLRADLCQIDHLFIHDPLTYLVKSHINVLRPLVIPVILGEMNSTLTVAMNSNWILYDTKCLNQSSQPQSFIQCLNCSHVLCLCR